MGRRSINLPTASLNAAFADLRADYSAAKSSRFRRVRSGIPAAGAGADYHYRNEGDYLRMMELSRDFFRNDVVVGQGVRRFADNVIRDGFTLDAGTGDSGVDKALETRWAEWAGDEGQCDVSGEATFHDFEVASVLAEVVDGDLFFLLTETGHLQAIEGHRVRTPSNALRRRDKSLIPVHGVLLDRYRRRKEVWVTNEDIAPTSALSNINGVTPYAVRDSEGHRQVLQVYRKDRVTQTRGVTHFAPIFDTIGMHDDIQFAKLVQQQIVSCFAILREMAVDAMASDMPSATGDLETEATAAGTTRILEGIAPGMDITARRGERISGFSPSVPNPEFFPHATLILSFIAINLGLPVAVLLLDPSQTNFSGWRGAIDQARMGFRRFQRHLINSFHSHVYPWKVRQWIADDPLLRAAAERSGVNLFAHRWHPPTWDYIEPLKDASADLLRTRNLLISHRRRCAERGFSWDDLSTEIVEDNALLIERAYQRAEALNKQYPGLGVTWREIACLPTPDGVTVSLSADSGDGAKPATNTNTENDEDGE